MNDILTCTRCGGKNRVRTVPANQVPVCARCQTPLPWLHEGSDLTFDQDIVAGVPVVVDLWAPWCGPCRVLGPILEEVAKEQAGKVRVVKINVDENPRVSARHQVRSIPTLLFFREGKLVDTAVGVLPKPQLLQRILQIGQARMG